MLRLFAFECGMGDGRSNVSAIIDGLCRWQFRSSHHFYILAGLGQTDTDAASESVNSSE